MYIMTVYFSLQCNMDVPQNLYWRLVVPLTHLHNTCHGLIIEYVLHHTKRVTVVEVQKQQQTTSHQATTVVDFVEADFMKYENPKEFPLFDLLLCSQVVEHVPDPSKFMKKLISSAKTSIISVPYNWPDCGRTCNHVSHFITLKTIEQWTYPYRPTHHTIIQEQNVGTKTSSRIIVVYHHHNKNNNDSKKNEIETEKII